MNTIEKTADRVGNFVARHKVAITVVATSTVWYAINRLALQQHNEFLAEHGLTEAFYTAIEE